MFLESLFMDLFPLVKSWRPDLSCSSCSTDLVVLWHSSEILILTYSFIFQESHGPFLAFKTTYGPPAYCYLTCTSVSTAIAISLSIPQLCRSPFCLRFLHVFLYSWVLLLVLVPSSGTLLWVLGTELAAGREASFFNCRAFAQGGSSPSNSALIVFVPSFGFIFSVYCPQTSANCFLGTRSSLSLTMGLI